MLSSLLAGGVLKTSSLRKSTNMYLAKTGSLANKYFSYITIPIYFAFYLFWRIFKRTHFIKASEADIWSGKAALDAEIWPEIKPRNMIERIWFWIA